MKLVSRIKFLISKCVLDTSRNIFGKLERTFFLMRKKLFFYYLCGLTVSNMDKSSNSLKYGLYGAVLSFVVMLLLLFSGNSPWSSASWMGCWIPGVTAYFVLKLYKEENTDIAISFFKVFKQSVQVIFFQALFFTIISVVFSGIVNTGAVEMYKAEMLVNEESIRLILGEEGVEMLNKELNNATFSTLAFSDFINKLIGGTIVSLILAGIFKKNKPIFENE